MANTTIPVYTGARSHCAECRKPLIVGALVSVVTDDPNDLVFCAPPSCQMSCRDYFMLLSLKPNSHGELQFYRQPRVIPENRCRVGDLIRPAGSEESGQLDKVAKGLLRRVLGWLF